MSSNTPPTPAAGDATGATIPLLGAIDKTGVIFTDTTGVTGFKSVDGQRTFSAAFPQTQGSPLSPFFSTAPAVFGVTSAIVSTLVNLFSTNRNDLADPNKLTVINTDAYLARIKDKKGIANIVIFDRASGNKQYRTASFIAGNVQIGRTEAASIVKTNEGFTLYSPDSNPVQMTLVGSLFSGDDWANAPVPGMIGHTDWFSKFLTDYNERLSSTASLSNDTDVWISYEDVFANVFITGITTATSADSPLVSGFTMQMVAKTVRFIARPDIDGSGPDEAETKDPLDPDAFLGNGTGTAPGLQIGDQGAVAPPDPSEVIVTPAPDAQLNPGLLPQVKASVVDSITSVYHPPLG